MKEGDTIRAILHAGMHKTGSSALQNSLHAARDSLLDAGVLYPIAGLHLDSPRAGYRHLGLRRSLEQEGSQSFVSKRLQQEIADNPCDTVVLSYEGFFTPGTDVEHLREALDDFETTVLLFLRHPVDYLESKYREWVRLLGYTGEIEHFLAWQWPFLDVLSLADKWEEQFGADQMVIRSYDSLQSPRDILDQLLALIPDSDVTLEPHPDSNPGATNEYTLAKLVANRLRLAGRPIERKVVESMELDYGGNGGRLLSSEAVAEIQQRAAPGFAELLNRYGQDPDLVSRWAACPRDDVFFDPSVRASVVGQLEVAREAAAAAAKRRKDKRVEAKAKAKATKRALENARARLKNTTAKLTELEGQLNKTQIRLAKVQSSKQALNVRLDEGQKRLAKAQTKKQALESRLDEMQDRLQQATDQRDYLRRRLDLLKVWRARNWPEYAVILKRRLKRRLGGR